MHTLLQTLIACASVTPEDAGCLEHVATFLKPLKFKLERLDFNQTSNLFAIYGDKGPLLYFVGHTDVVPPGEGWSTPPFTLTTVNDTLVGRGIADMKGGVVAFLHALKDFLAHTPTPHFRIAVLLTSDEEGKGMDGIRRIVPWLIEQDYKPTWVLVGEPSASKTVGDTIKIGRRGSLTGTLTIQGQQGHIAYAKTHQNPMHALAAFIMQVSNHVWTTSDPVFAATQFQCTDVRAGIGADNVIPATAHAIFNFRYAPPVTHTEIQQKVTAFLNNSPLPFTLEWHHSGLPFYKATPGPLRQSLLKAIKSVTQLEAVCSTQGGTSDGRHFAQLDCEIVECGLVNATIHQPNEQIAIGSLETLKAIYQAVLEELHAAT